MSSVRYRSVYSAAQELSIGERKTLARALLAGDNNFGKPEEQAALKESHEVSEDWLLQGMIGYMVKHGMLPSRGAFSGWEKRKAYKAYVEKAPQVIAFLERVEKQFSTTTKHRHALITVGMTSLVTLFKSWDLDIVPGLLLAQVDRMPEAIEKQFPGYIASETFGMVINLLESDA